MDLGWGKEVMLSCYGTKGEVRDEPGPEGGGDEAGDGEGEEEAGEAEEDDPEGAEGMDASKGDEEPGVRDEANEEKPGEEEDAEGEYGVSSIEYGEEEAGPRERGEVGAGVIDEERARGALPPSGRSSEQEDAVDDDEAEQEQGGGESEREEDRPGGHEGFSGQRIGSHILVNNLDDGQGQYPSQFLRHRLQGLFFSEIGPERDGAGERVVGGEEEEPCRPRGPKGGDPKRPRGSEARLIRAQWGNCWHGELLRSEVWERQCKGANRSGAPVQRCKSGGKRDGVAWGYAGTGVCCDANAEGRAAEPRGGMLAWGNCCEADTYYVVTRLAVGSGREAD